MQTAAKLRENKQKNKQLHLGKRFVAVATSKIAGSDSFRKATTATAPKKILGSGHRRNSRGDGGYIPQIFGWVGCYAKYPQKI